MAKKTTDEIPNNIPSPDFDTEENTVKSKKKHGIGHKYL